MLKFEIQNRRYVGSKYKLKEWLKENILANTKGKTFVDIFSGTGVVSQIFSEYYDKIIINDFLYSNNIVYKAFFNQDEFEEKKIVKLIEKWNLHDITYENDNYFNKMFADKFFGKRDSKKIGYIREEIENLYKSKYINEKEYSILLASLIYSADKISNTVGHYDAYIKKEVKDDRFILGMIKPLKLKNKVVEIYREDANLLARKIKADIAFIDPPYNSRQYSRFYHLLENLTKWEKPELYGVALKPKEENMSGYCKVTAPKLFRDLILNLDVKYICVTYNNTYNSKSSSSKNKITFEEIKNILEEVGSTKIISIAHQFFNAGKTKFNDHREYLFITEVQNEKSN